MLNANIENNAGATLVKNEAIFKELEDKYNNFTLSNMIKEYSGKVVYDDKDYLYKIVKQNNDTFIYLRNTDTENKNTLYKLKFTPNEEGENVIWQKANDKYYIANPNRREQDFFLEIEDIEQIQNRSLIRIARAIDDETEDLMI